MLCFNVCERKDDSHYAIGGNNSVTMFEYYSDQEMKGIENINYECIPVGCIPPTAVAIC